MGRRKGHIGGEGMGSTRNRTDRLWPHDKIRLETVTPPSPACVFTAQCTLVQMRGLGIACPPSVCPSVCDVGGLRSHRLEILETNCTDN